MIDKVIVTICVEKEDFSVDMELPAQLPIEELIPKIVDTLRGLQPAKFDKLETLTMFFLESPLNKGSTLAAEAVWDGSILIVR